MKKLLFICALLVSIASSTSAQSGQKYVFGNFDTMQGVTVHVAPEAPKIKPTKISKRKGAGLGQTANSKVNLTVLQQPSGFSLPMAAGKTLGNYSTGDARVDNYILTSTQRYNIDPLLVYATMSQESSFKPRAISYKGARGLMQLMPATALRFGVTDIFNPQQNIEAGVKYLRFLLDTFKGDIRLALAGYNAGEGAVMKYGYQIPPYNETQDYVRRITARYAMMRDPNFVRSVARLPVTVQANKPVNTTAEVILPPPPPLYEQSSIAVKLPNGKIQLVTQ
jgi:hypothetical protein